jgi:hypothetical protein
MEIQVQKFSSLPTTSLHSVPCHIEHDGPANVRFI